MDTLGLYFQYFLAITNSLKYQCMRDAIILEFLFHIIILEYGRPNREIFPPISLQITALGFDLCL